LSDIWARTGYPVCMLCAMTGAWYALESGISPFAVFGIVSVISLLFVISGEFLQRFNQDWRPTLKENWYPDGVTVLINNFLLQSPVVQLTISGLAMGLAGGGLQVWPNDWSLFIQVPLALVLGEFGAYWWHRASHEWPLLWRFHKVHHSPTRLYWLNATKFHYVDVTILQSCTVLPVLILGANETTVLFITLFSIFHGYWQHGNTRQNLGFLNFLFSNAELHRWHHNEQIALANHNYGSNLVVWDLVFGTFFWPERGHGTSGTVAITDIGIEDHDYPIDPFRKLVQPFTRQG
jgi:sterol desaturase/sphingolipid hydroxylase (fatty acid hydroxylase superfamily)